MASYVMKVTVTVRRESGPVMSNDDIKQALTEAVEFPARFTVTDASNPDFDVTAEYAVGDWTADAS